MRNISRADKEHRQAANPDVRFMAKLDANFVPGIRGLITRGLVAHQYHEREPWNADNVRPFGDFYQITSAGWHVIGLLKGAGLWQAYLDAMPWLDQKERAAA